MLRTTKLFLLFILFIFIASAFIHSMQRLYAQTTGTRIAFTIRLHGIGKGGDNVNPTSTGNLNPTRPQRTLTVQIYNSSNQLVQTTQGAITYNATAGNFQGTINLGVLGSGIYTLRVESDQYLRKSLPAIFTITQGQLTQVPIFGMVTGDVNNDNVISILDYTAILDCFSDFSAPRNCSGPAKKLMTDITDDSNVNELDYNLLLRELSVQGGDDEWGTVTPIPTNPVATPTRTPTQPVPTITPSLTPSPTQTSGATYPAQVLNLTDWKVTLPIGSSGSPTEIKQPALATYKIDPWFIVAPSGNGVRLRAPVNGVTTSGSSYPRSELREMANNGTSNASWTSTSGTHTMYLDQAITAVPTTKRHVVAGQIHDANDDVIVIRLEYPKLFIDINGNDGPVLDANYTLGKRFNVKFVVNGGKTMIYYNGNTTPAYTLTKSYSGAYFKTGAYTQSNCSTEGSSSLCTSSNYGEVIVYQATVTHQ